MERLLRRTNPGERGSKLNQILLSSGSGVRANAAADGVRLLSLRLLRGLFLERRLRRCQARDRDDNLIFVRERVLRSEVDVTGLLLLYRRIHLGELVPDDETNPLVSILHLSGIARGVNGFLQVRNRIYRHVFDLAWIQTNMPEAEVRRQKSREVAPLKARLKEIEGDIARIEARVRDLTDQMANPDLYKDGDRAR